MVPLFRLALYLQEIFPAPENTCSLNTLVAGIASILRATLKSWGNTDRLSNQYANGSMYFLVFNMLS
jgi:hypothetical protein